MSDLNIIQELEKMLDIKLPKLKQIDVDSRGYTTNKSEQIIGISLINARFFDLLYVSQKLAKIDITDSELWEIIDLLKKLTQLSVLDLSENQISDVTPLSTLTQLSALRLHHMQIDDVTPLENLTQLSVLHLGRNQISDFAPLQNLTQLATLDLGKNQISDITPLENLTQLAKLDLGKNQISDIAPLQNLTQVATLDLSDNQISDITPLQNLTQLAKLNLEKNQISDIAPLKNLTQLSEIHIPSNQISDITPLKNLTQLMMLDLSENQISNITPLASLEKPKSLNLQNNQITSLPRWITNFKEEILWKKEEYMLSDGVNFFGNPLRTPSPEIVKQGKEAIANYFAQLDEQAEDHIFEAKMLIVGEPGAGKTSLAWKINDENCALPESEDTTKGIDVKPYEFEIPEEDVASLTDNNKGIREAFRLNLWDFGGQEIYKATHRFFLSKRSLYALVADSRNEDTDFNYWLHIVEMFGGESPLLIVLNEKYQRKKKLDIPAMKARFSNIVDVISVDLAEDDKTRLHQLTQAIRYHVSRLPHIGSPVPARWTDVREALEKNIENTITLKEYLAVCRENGIKKHADALVLSQYFHDIGVFLHFQDDPLLRRTIFLNATWATNAVYQILDDPLLNEQEGRFCKADAEKIWLADEFALLRDELLQLMKKFFLTYEIGNTGEYIVPERLPPNTPNYHWELAGNLILQYKYDFFMPKGLLSQFIVQMNHYITDHILVWQRGVILEREGAKAEVIESYDKRNIHIRVLGKNRRDFMTIISETIDKLNSQYEKMKVEKLIPCNCAECKISETPYFFEHADLKRRIEKGRREVECGKSYEMVNVKALIDDLVNEGLSKYARAKQDIDSLFARGNRIFISYSHKDSKWLKRVQVHLKGLQHLKIDANAWDDTHIKSGEQWFNEIKVALAYSRAAILLISADFLASDFIANEELPELLRVAENDGLTILPVIIKPSLFTKTKLGEFQTVNDPAKPLAALTESEADAELVKLAMRISKLVNIKGYK